ncbi:hypothetical protein JXL21_13300 [Candidatus Bathyarchaeota archaeon]|nr:hypothetical protein [Candidatus Bathyarchaeota archaeon]
MVLILTPTLLVGGADDTHWIEKYEIKDLTTGRLVLSYDVTTGTLVQNAPVFAGAEYDITFTLNVRQNIPFAVLTLSLSTNLLKPTVEDVFWNIQTTEMDVTEDYNPADRTIKFSQNQGVYEVSVYALIKRDITTPSSSQGVTIHRPVDLKILRLIGPDETELDSITVNIIDSRIDDYNLLLSQRQGELADYRNSNVDPAYIELFEKFMEVAKSEAQLGLVDSAIELLTNLEVEAPPVQTGPSWMEQYFLPAVGGLAVLFILSLVLFLRTRSKLGFVTMIVEDQIREMEALQMRASRIDRNLAQRLTEINERLKEAERN